MNSVIDLWNRFTILLWKEGLLTTVYRSLRYFILELKLFRPFFLQGRRLHTKIGYYLDSESFTDANPFKIIYADPDDIVAKQQKKFHKWRAVGRVHGGDWDKGTIPIYDDSLYHAFVQRYKHGNTWLETEFVQQKIDAVDDGKVTWHNCETKQDILDRCEQIDLLYTSIDEEGYRLSSEIGDLSWRKELDEITVNIGRDGALIRNNSGRHRLYIAKLLDLDRVPLRVLVRHEEWQLTRNQIRANTVTTNHNHPDLTDIRPE